MYYPKCMATAGAGRSFEYYRRFDSVPEACHSPPGFWQSLDQRTVHHHTEFKRGGKRRYTMPRISHVVAIVAAFRYLIPIRESCIRLV